MEVTDGRKTSRSNMNYQQPDAAIAMAKRYVPPTEHFVIDGTSLLKMIHKIRNVPFDTDIGNVSDSSAICEFCINVSD